MAFTNTSNEGGFQFVSIPADKHDYTSRKTGSIRRHASWWGSYQRSVQETSWSALEKDTQMNSSEALVSQAALVTPRPWIEAHADTEGFSLLLSIRWILSVHINSIHIEEKCSIFTQTLQKEFAIFDQSSTYLEKLHPIKLEFEKTWFWVPIMFVSPFLQILLRVPQRWRYKFMISQAVDDCIPLDPRDNLVYYHSML